MYPRFQILGPRNPNDTDGGLPSGYLREGFLAVQNAIANQFLRLKSDGTTMPEIMMQVSYSCILLSFKILLAN